MTAPPWRAMPASLTTPRLALGPWRDDDLDAYAAMVVQRDPRAAAAPRDGHPTRDELRATVTRQQTTPAATGIGLYAVRVSGRFVGYCGLTAGRSTLDEPELAYELLRAEHGRGYATEAARAVVEAAAAAGRTALWATVRPWNTASFRVLDKLGFTRSGRVTVDEYGESVWCRYGFRRGEGPQAVIVDAASSSQQGGRMGKYDPLRDHLAALTDRAVVRMTFNEIAGLVGSLPASAWQHREWWANNSQTQSLAWREADWHVAVVDQRDEWVEFEPGAVGGTYHDNGREPGGPRA